MNDTAMEKKLAEHGFSEKEISRLKEISIRDNENYLSLLHDLRKRFYAGVIIIAAFIILLAYSFFANGGEEFASFSFAALIVFACVYFIIPIPLATKAFIYITRTK